MREVTVELRDPEAILAGDGENPGGMTRLALLRRAAATGTAALIGGGLAVTGVPAAFGQSRPSDADILNLLLLNESLEVAFYTEAIARAGLTGRPLAFARQVLANEIVHRDAARAALGPQARPIPGFAFRDATANQANFLTTALALENGDVATINGAGPVLRSKQLLGAAGQVVSVESRQAAWIRRIVYADGGYASSREYPAPVAFEPAITYDQARETLRATGFVQGEV